MVSCSASSICESLSRPIQTKRTTPSSSMKTLVDYLMRQAADLAAFRQLSAAIGTGPSLRSEGAAAGWADVDRHVDWLCRLLWPLVSGLGHFSCSLIPASRGMLPAPRA